MDEFHFGEYGVAEIYEGSVGFGVDCCGCSLAWLSPQEWRELVIQINEELARQSSPWRLAGRGD